MMKPASLFGFHGGAIEKSLSLEIQKYKASHNKGFSLMF